jgi:type I restriction enzyme S subunit
MKLKPYPEYKDSGVPWLGEIPAHWEMKRVKYLFDERTEKGFPNEPLLAATQTKGVVPKTMYKNRTVMAQKDLHLLKLVEPDDFVISLRSFQGGIERAYYRGIISPAYTVMIPQKEVSPDYFKHLAKSKVFLELLKTCVTGIREGQNIDYSFLRKAFLPRPVSEEQTQIARYLDWKTAQINKFIRNKRRLIGLLKEQKQIIINRAVTRGLDPNIKLKPSGVEWLGDIPEHWETVKLKHISSMKSGDNLTSYQIVESGEYPVYGGNGLRGYFNEYNREGKHLLIGRQGALCGNIHSVEGKFWATEHAIVASARGNILIKWYYYILSVMNLNQYSESAAQPGLSVEKILDLRTILPPCDEQDAIAEYIEREVEPLDQAIARAEREIELMTEYRARLISDVVTGKVDVRGIDVTQIVDDEFPTADEETDYEDELLEEEIPEEGFEDEDE